MNAKVAGFVGLALLLFTAANLPAFADDAKTHEGMVVSAADGKLVMMTDGKEHSHKVAASVPVTVNGKVAKLEDLKKGMQIKVSTDKDGNVLSVATVDAKKKL